LLMFAGLLLVVTGIIGGIRGLRMFLASRVQTTNQQAQ
jgi:hypothetical protein